MSEWQQTACILCECNCGLEVSLGGDDGRSLVKIRGDKAHPASAGYTCEKPLRLDRYQNGPHRITSPLRRRPDGTYEEIDWDTAISEIAAKLAQIKQAYGGEKIFFYGGGGQGNHLGVAYGQSLRAAVGSKFYSNALAQEKTGEMYIDGRLYGGHTKGDFEHSEVVVFVGKNPWQTHSFPRARPTLRAIQADPERSMIVIDPRRSETAELADFHLQVKPGTDAWCLAGMGAVLVQEDLLDHEFIAEHTTGAENPIAALKAIDVADFAAKCGVPEDLLRAAARRIGTAETVTTYEDLGIQQAPHSTLSSYLNKLLWILTGNFGKPGTMYLHSSFVSLAGGGSGGDGKPRKPPSLQQRVVGNAMKRAVPLAAGAVSRGAAATAGLPGANVAARALLGPLMAPAGKSIGSPGPSSGGKRTPVTGARVIGGLIPCNSIADEILTDHPDRFRAMWIDAVNPAHSLADSKRFREAMRALDLTVVIDISMTETARNADYVLPAASQFEKWECTFFNFEFPHNVFQLRAPLMAPLEGTLTEPEIYARVIRALGVVDERLLKRLRKAAEGGRASFAASFFTAAAADPKVMGLASYLLYETLGPTLPNDARNAAALWGAAHLCSLGNPAAVRRAGFTGEGLEPGEKLFDAILHSREGVTFTVDRWADVWNYVGRRDKRFTVDLQDMVETIRGLADETPGWTTPEFPFVLAAGERRSFTANTIIRDPSWRRRDAQGALRMSPADASKLGVEAGATVRVVTNRGSAEAVVEITDTLQTGHVTLPNGLGVGFPGADGAEAVTGVAPNELTDTERRDPIAGTPWHKYVPARIEPIAV